MRTYAKIGGLALAAATIAGALTAPAGAVTAPYSFAYLAAAGATRVTAFDNSIVSDTTNGSAVQGYALPTSNSNDTASVTVNGVLHTGAAASSASADATTTGGVINSQDTVADVNLLGGLITVDTVKTVASTTIDNHQLSAQVDTTFAGIHIAGVDLPVNIPKNFNVTIPNVAQIVLDLSYSATNNGIIATQGAAIYVSLLSPQGDLAKGAQIFVNPTFQVIQTHVPGTPYVVGGTAYDTHVTVGVGDAVGINSGPTELQNLSAGGTGGQAKTVSAAAVNITGLLNTGVASTTVSGTATKQSADAKTSASIAGLNLLNGLITADALTVTAHAHRATDGTVTYTRKMTFVNLTIAGHPISLKVAPNTTLNVAGLGKVVINQQATVGSTTGIRALFITLSTARAGLPVGASIEVAAASATLVL